MAGIDEINSVSPTWRVEHKNEKDPGNGKKKKSHKKPPRSQKNQNPDDGRPHIDEYA